MAIFFHPFTTGPTANFADFLLWCFHREGPLALFLFNGPFLFAFQALRVSMTVANLLQVDGRNPVISQKKMRKKTVNEDLGRCRF